MIDYYLRVASAQALEQALLDTGAASIEDGQLVAAPGVALDIIGTWYDVPAEEGAEPVPRDGFYANVRSEAPITWPAGVELPEPETPWRVWA
ncbi:hypothetical protein SAMN05216577_12850 [Pseudomonas citronellolis]|uniref:Uncharacterized protein n=1 Tax=Pseudomonas citronellolis TaxID=53408 RepID=A0AAQ1KJ88_9PSED|nr:hypothetical protein [Pseudomonas citronellolis]TGC32440.1 hypothetical protein CW310_02110 [Pseudomonas citronellolis]SFD52774.1 hypothetical protein SAMN05216577_12850 [Pseudomonas citronellolis]